VVIGTVAMAEPFYRDIQPSNLAVFLAGIIVIGIMMIRKSPGALICGILASTLCAFALGIEKIPSVVPLCAPDLSGSLFKSELFTTLTPEIIPIVVLFFLLTFFDSIATILGLSSLTHQAGRPEELQEIRKPFLINAFSMIFSPLVGSTTTGIFIESVSGVKEGGRTGLVAVTVAVLMAASLFFLPLIEAFPKGATAAVLMVIGLLMLAQFRVQSFSNREELLTAFVLMVTMSITQNIGLGLSIGLLVYPVFMAAAGKHTEISRSFWFLVGCAVLFLTMFPY
jgi:adenine/guanine/hypoxanthine permease